MALIEDSTEVEDPWDLPELQHKGIKWSGKNEASLGRQEGAARWQETDTTIFTVPPLFPLF